MSKIRNACVNKERCGQTGHYQVEGKWQRCPCLTLEIHQMRLGQMFCKDPRLDTPLKSKLQSNLRLEGPLDTLRPHIAGALLHMSSRGEKYVIMDAYRLIEIFLEKDEEYASSRPTIETDLLVLLLGFGDPRNRYLPELLVQALSRRALDNKPTWVVMGVDLSLVSTKYNSELQAQLASFEKAGGK
jgi:hypothetical protein